MRDERNQPSTLDWAIVAVAWAIMAMVIYGVAGVAWHAIAAWWRS